MTKGLVTNSGIVHWKKQRPFTLRKENRHPQSIAQDCWVRLHSSSNIVWGTHTWFTKSYGLYLFPDALSVPTLLGVVLSENI